MGTVFFWSIVFHYESKFSKEYLCHISNGRRYMTDKKLLLWKKSLLKEVSHQWSLTKTTDQYRSWKVTFPRSTPRRQCSKQALHHFPVIKTLMGNIQHCDSDPAICQTKGLKKGNRCKLRLVALNNVVDVKCCKGLSYPCETIIKTGITLKKIPRS